MNQAPHHYYELWYGPAATRLHSPLPANRTPTHRCPPIQTNYCQPIPKHLSFFCSWVANAQSGMRWAPRRSSLLVWLFFFHPNNYLKPTIVTNLILEIVPISTPIVVDIHIHHGIIAALFLHIVARATVTSLALHCSFFFSWQEPQAETVPYRCPPSYNGGPLCRTRNRNKVCIPSYIPTPWQGSVLV